jgi:hypothetical protein
VLRAEIQTRYISKGSRTATGWTNLSHDNPRSLNAVLKIVFFTGSEAVRRLSRIFQMDFGLYEEDKKGIHIMKHTSVPSS